MNDDWRLQVDLQHAGQARALTEQLQTPELEHDLERAYQDRVVVSSDGPVVFCYAASREQAERAETVELSQRLGDEGLESVHRWRYLLLGALDQDSANALAQRLGSELPSGATVTVEATGRAVLDEQGSNPFAVLGGLAG